MPRTLGMVAGLCVAATCAALADGVDVASPGSASGQPQLRPALLSPVDCGPAAARAAAVLGAVARTGRIDAAGQAALEALVAGEDALRHADLATVALAVAFEQDLSLEGVTPARRDALLEVLLRPVLPRSDCLAAEVLVRLRARLLVTCCAELHARPVPIERWGQEPARPFLLLVERVGPPIPQTCRRVLRRELGDPDEIHLGPAPPDDAPPSGLGSALVPPPDAAGR